MSNSPASAGPRVSDERLAMWLDTVRHHSRVSLSHADAADAIRDLQSARAALAAANARIAVLEAERIRLREALVDIELHYMSWLEDGDADDAVGDLIAINDIAVAALGVDSFALATASPFPSAVVIFRPATEQEQPDAN